jgi:hypothetical protein
MLQVEDIPPAGGLLLSLLLYQLALSKIVEMPI